MSDNIQFHVRIMLLTVLILLLTLLVGGCDGRAAAPLPTLTPTPAAAAVSEAGIPESLLNPDAGGASVWIEFPFQGQTLPDQPLTFVAYASSAGGVEGISLLVDGQVLMGGTLKDLSNDGDGSMVRLESTWQPPGPGEYVLAAEAAGAASSVTFCVVNCSGELELQPSETPTPTPGPTETPTPTPAGQDIQFWAVPTNVKAGDCTTLHWKAPGATKITLDGRVVTNLDSFTECICAGNAYQLIATYADGTTVQRQTIVTVTGDCTQPDETEYILNFWAEPETITAGGCTTLHWESKDYTTITLHAQSVSFAGTDEKCPCVGTTYPITGTKEDGTTDERTVTIAVNGSCEVPQTDPPADPPPVTDTDGPENDGISLVWESCSFFGQASLEDPSGVDQAKFEFNLNNEGWKSIWMADIGSGLWQSEVGIPVNDGIGTPMGGSIDYKVWAKDTLNNESTTLVITEPYDACTP
jgi:hypothetical protein